MSAKRRTRTEQRHGPLKRIGRWSRSARLSSGRDRRPWRREVIGLVDPPIGAVTPARHSTGHPGQPLIRRRRRTLADDPNGRTGARTFQPMSEQGWPPTPVLHCITPAELKALVAGTGNASARSHVENQLLWIGPIFVQSDANAEDFLQGAALDVHQCRVVLRGTPAHRRQGSLSC